MKSALLFWLLGSIAIVAAWWHWHGALMAGVGLLGQLLVLSVSVSVYYYRKAKDETIADEVIEELWRLRKPWLRSTGKT